MEFQKPKTVWVWHVFGKDDNGSLLSVALPRDVSWWKRLVCRFFLGSVWDRPLETR